MKFERALVFAVFSSLAACSGPPPVLGDGIEGDAPPDGGPVLATLDLGPVNLGIGVTARVTAATLNLRDGVGTAANILVAMPCGTAVPMLAGPSTTPAAGWWQVTYSPSGMQPMTGWASGKYLVAEAAFDAGLCGSMVDSGTGNSAVDDIFTRAKLAVGYSYYWGHGSWRDDGAQPGSCAGSCPSCSHNGQYGADCSGLIAKCWQVPGPSPLTQDLHPYSTYNFFNEETHWSKQPRASTKPADAMVYRAGSSGHIVLVESTTDPFGQLWLYEARGCATGVVHNLRSLATGFITVRREGL